MSIFLDNPHESLDLSAEQGRGEDELHHSLKNIVSKIVVGWDKACYSDISIEKLTGGISNLLFLVAWHSKEKVIVRLYGQGTEKFIDRSLENVIFSELSKNEYSPRFLGLFEGGRVEGYLQARALDPDEFSSPGIFMKMGKILLQR